MCKITVPQQSFLSFECLDFPKFADLKHLKSLNIDGHISLRVETNWKSSVDFPDQATFSENLNLCWHNQLNTIQGLFRMLILWVLSVNKIFI